MVDPNIVIISSDDVDAKRQKVEQFLRYSAECGTLTPDPTEA
jgi:hypothetical protein